MKNQVNFLYDCSSQYHDVMYLCLRIFTCPRYTLVSSVKNNGGKKKKEKTGVYSVCKSRLINGECSISNLSYIYPI